MGKKCKACGHDDRFEIVQNKRGYDFVRCAACHTPIILFRESDLDRSLRQMAIGLNRAIENVFGKSIYTGKMPGKR